MSPLIFNIFVFVRRENMPIYKDQKRNTWFVQTKAKNNLGASVTIKKRGFSSYRLAKAYEKKLWLH